MNKMINNLQKNKLLMGLIIAAVLGCIYLIYKNHFESERMTENFYYYDTDSGAKYPDNLGVTTSTTSENSNCNILPESPKGSKHPKGCAGAVMRNGYPTPFICNNASGKYKWYKDCCNWNPGSSKCTPK
jgi:hypothetical protein